MLPFLATGPQTGTPVILLHGFCGDRTAFSGVNAHLKGARRVIAFDLPGHGQAVDVVHGHAGHAAKAVVAALDTMGVERFHLVGHSMGGATAALIALRLATTNRVASAILVAPGGFGPRSNHRLLSALAEATEADAIHALFGQFVDDAFDLPRTFARELASARAANPALAAAHRRVGEGLIDGTGQKTLDRAAINALPHPVRLVWGRADRVLPVEQAMGLAGTIGLHLFDGVGHMPHWEIPEALARIILETTAA
jgi:pimeloyl-ACP methyl ester carboxylesterase